MPKEQGTETVIVEVPSADESIGELESRMKGTRDVIGGILSRSADGENPNELTISSTDVTNLILQLTLNQMVIMGSLQGIVAKINGKVEETEKL